MPLKMMRALDYDASYAYAPPTVECVVNTDEIVSATPIESRHAGPTMLVHFKSGKSLTLVGKPADLLEP